VAVVAGAVEDLLTEAFTAVGLTVDFADLLFRFVISGSPEKPKGPGEGALRQVGGSEKLSAAATGWVPEQR
jgi:hypothetical protein